MSAAIYLLCAEDVVVRKRETTMPPPPQRLFRGHIVPRHSVRNRILILIYTYNGAVVVRVFFQRGSERAVALRTCAYQHTEVGMRLRCTRVVHCKFTDIHSTRARKNVLSMGSRVPYAVKEFAVREVRLLERSRREWHRERGWKRPRGKKQYNMYAQSEKLKSSF